MRDYLNQKEKLGLDKFSQGLRELLGNNLISLILFGSKIKGNYTQDSDIDLLVVVKEKTPQIRHQIHNILFNIDPYYELKISALLYSELEYKKNEELESPFIENLKKEGAKL
ncbi:nucleotidyltransferase domain-containing protein [bacterium]|nr:nucleotidyltransferase domain-containing protein [bacterium]